MSIPSATGEVEVNRRDASHALFRTLVRGRAAKAALLAGSVGPVLCDALESDIQRGETARAALVSLHEGLAMSVCKRYTLPRGMTYEDLRSEAMAGLLNAIDRFDPERGWQFSTFAVWPIRTAVQGAIRGWVRGVPDSERSFMLGSDVGEDAAALVRATSPSVEDLCCAAIGTETVVGMLRRSLGSLSDLERAAVEMHYGLFGNEPQDLSSVAETCGVGLEAARRLCGMGLAKLSHPCSGVGAGLERQDLW